MSAHAYLPPSGAACWSKCSAWPDVNRDAPDEPTPEALEGTAMHAAAEFILNGRQRAVTTPAAGLVGQVFEGVVVSLEMADAVQVYVDHCASLMCELDTYGSPLLSVERHVQIPSVNEKCNGTLDFGLYAPHKRVLHVVDFKGGHRYVDEYECLQLICYASGLLDFYKIDGNLDQVTDVVLTIVQPRCYGGGGAVRSWSVKASELRPYVNTLHTAAERIMAGDRTATTGTHCHYCPGKLHCEAFMRSAGNAVDVSETYSPFNLTDAQLASALDNVATAHARLGQAKDALEEQIKARLRAGVQVGSYALEPSYGRRRWTRPAAEIKMLGELLGAELIREEPITPNQAEKLGVDSSIINAYSTRSQNGSKLTKLDQRQLERFFK